MSRNFGFGSFFESFTSFRSLAGGGIGRLFPVLTEVARECVESTGGGSPWGTRFSAMNARICWSRSKRREERTGTGEVPEDKESGVKLYFLPVIAENYDTRPP